MTKVFPTSYCRGGGGQFHVTKKITFLAEFCDEYYTIYLYTKNNHIQVKKYQKMLPFQNGNQMTDFSFASFWLRQKIWKATFPKEFFSEMWGS